MTHPSPSAAAEIIALYERHADAFDRLRGKSGFEAPWLERFLAASPSPLPVLDLGCGAAEPMARILIERGRQVWGIDSAPAMIALCRARFPDQTWQVGDMRRLDLGQRFGGLLAWHSFFHLTPDDQRAMFPIFAAHAAPQAALMFTSGPDAGESFGTFEGKTLYHASLSQDEYRELLTTHGFEVLRHVAQDPEAGGATVWLAQRR